MEDKKRREFEAEIQRLLKPLFEVTTETGRKLAREWALYGRVEVKLPNGRIWSKH